MNSEKTFLQIIKLFIIIASVIGVIVRANISVNLVNYYMAIVNTASFFVSFNLLMYECYYKLRKCHKEIKENIIRKARIWNVVMLFYILIFVFNVGALCLVGYLYIGTDIDLSLINDGLGIVALGLAIATDFLSDFIINIIILVMEKI